MIATYLVRKSGDETNFGFKLSLAQTSAAMSPGQETEKGAPFIKSTISAISDTVYETTMGIEEGIIGGTRVLFTGTQPQPVIPASMESIQRGASEAMHSASSKVKEMASSTGHQITDTSLEAAKKAKAAYESIPRYPNREPPTSF